MIDHTLDLIQLIFVNRVLQMFHVDVYHLMIQHNDASILNVDKYLLLKSVSAVSLQVIVHTPLSLVYTCFELHTDEQCENELKKDKNNLLIKFNEDIDLKKKHTFKFCN